MHYLSDCLTRSISVHLCLSLSISVYFYVFLCLCISVYFCVCDSLSFPFSFRPPSSYPLSMNSIELGQHSLAVPDKRGLHKVPRPVTLVPCLTLSSRFRSPWADACLVPHHHMTRQCILLCDAMPRHATLRDVTSLYHRTAAYRHIPCEMCRGFDPQRASRGCMLRPCTAGWLRSGAPQRWPSASVRQPCRATQERGCSPLRLSAGSEDVAAAEHLLLAACGRRAAHYGLVLRACASSGDLDRAAEWHSRACAQDVRLTVRTYELLHQALHRSGGVVDREEATGGPALRALERECARVFPRRALDVVAYTRELHAHAKAGHPEAVSQCFFRMEAASIIPDATAFTCAIDSCARVGRVQEAVRWFEMMKAARVSPGLVSYNCVLKAFARAGQSRGAAAWLSEMEAARVRADRVSYNSVLGACAAAGEAGGAASWLQRIGMPPGSDLKP